MMQTPMTWLLAGAAVALTAGAAVAQTDQAARRQATEDSAGAAKSGERIERREFRVYRQGDGDEGPAVRGYGRGGRSGHLSDILQLRADQQPALKTFLEATRRDDDDRRDHMVKFERDGQRTTLARLDDMQARMTEQQAETSRRIAAIRTFYGQLDAGQRKAFDALPILMMVGPSMGPMVIPHRIAMAEPPAPPRPPQPPEPPRY